MQKSRKEMEVLDFGPNTITWRIFGAWLPRNKKKFGQIRLDPADHPNRLALVQHEGVSSRQRMMLGQLMTQGHPSVFSGCPELGMGQIKPPGDQVLVHVSTYQRSMWGTYFDLLRIGLDSLFGAGDLPSTPYQGFRSASKPPI